jgi:hypothetical protein
MVRRALEREVDGDLQAVLPGRGNEIVEVVEGSEVGVDRVVTTLVRADRPRRTGIAGTRIEGVVRPLAVDAADRVHRRQVDHVEAHRSHGGQPLGSRAQRAGYHRALLVDARALGAREELVPGADQRPLTVCEDRVRRTRAQQVPQWVGEKDRVHLRRGAGPQPHLDRKAGVLQQLDGVAEHLSAAPRAGWQGRCSATQQGGALDQHELHVDACGDLDLGVVLPGRHRVAPRLHAEAPGALAVGGHLRDVPVRGSGGAHADRRTVAALRVGEDHLGAQGVVALAEDGGENGERLADGGLGGERAALDHRVDVHDRNACCHRWPT